MIQVGKQAPEFALKSAEGKSIRLSDFRGLKSVVLFFYPKDDTPGCTREACTFRDQYELFQETGAEVIGISSDSVESHKRFAGKYRFPFILLSDGEGMVRKLYQVPKVLGLLPGRVTFVIDRNGIVRHAFSSQWNPTRHIKESLTILRGL